MTPWGRIETGSQAIIVDPSDRPGMGTVTWEHLDNTEDTGDPVLRGRINDSWLDAILETDQETIRVAHVVSKHPGDMRRMLSDIVESIGWHDVIFLTPLDDLKPDGYTKLIDRLDGFEKDTIESDRVGTIEIYRGRWEP